MTYPRDYTLDEIDAMREAIRQRMIDGQIHLLGEVEQRLRTYMSAGVTLADLRGGVKAEPDMFGADSEG